MNTVIRQELINLATGLAVTYFVWNYYREQTVSEAKRYSTFFARFWTGNIDACVLWPISFMNAALLSSSTPKPLAALLVIVESLAWLLYTVVMHARFGQTVGKMVTRVRVLDYRTGGSLSWRQAWIREGIPTVVCLGLLGWEVALILNGKLNPGDVAVGGEFTASKDFWLLSVLPALWFAAEIVTMLTNEKRRALHDFIAGTVVVRTNVEERAVRDAPPDIARAAQAGLAGVQETPPAVH